MRAVSIPGSADEAALAAGLELPQINSPSVLGGVSVFCKPSTTGFIHVRVKDGAGNPIVDSFSSNHTDASPFALIQFWPFKGALESFSGDSANPVCTQQFLPLLLLDPQWTVSVILAQTPGSGGQVFGVTFLLDEVAAVEHRDRDDDEKKHREKPSFQEALRRVVDRYNATQQAAIRALGGQPPDVRQKRDAEPPAPPEKEDPWKSKMKNQWKTEVRQSESSVGKPQKDPSRVKTNVQKKRGPTKIRG